MGVSLKCGAIHRLKVPHVEFSTNSVATALSKNSIAVFSG